MIQSLQELWQWGDGILASLILALLTCAGFWVVAGLLYRKVGPALFGRAEGKRHPITCQLLKGFNRPISVFLKVAGICAGLLVLSRQLENELLPATLRAAMKALPPVAYRTLRVAVIVVVAWGLIASSDITALLLRNARNKLDLRLSKSVSRFLTAVFNVVVAAVAAVILLKEFGYDINGLVAGLGLGGLTVALAAKDSASNFFGGLVLVMEKPFEIGDWITCEGVEGTVEDINLRSTMIRTADGSLTIVPNATVAGAPITNWGGGMEKRRADFTLNLTYDTSRPQMRDFTAALQTMLETDPDIISDSIIVRFSGLAQSSLDVRVIFYTSQPGFADHMRVRERVNYALMDIAARYGVDYAFPSRSVYLTRPAAGDDEPAPEPNENTTA